MMMYCFELEFRYLILLLRDENALPSTQLPLNNNTLLRYSTSRCVKFDNIHSNTYATGGILTSFGIALIRVPCGMLPVLERIALITPTLPAWTSKDKHVSQLQLVDKSVR